MFIFGYAKALKEATEENQELTTKLKDAYIEIFNLKEATEENQELTTKLKDAYIEIFNLNCEIKKLTEKVNKQKQELKNTTYKWK